MQHVRKWLTVGTVAIGLAVAGCGGGGAVETGATGGGSSSDSLEGVALAPANQLTDQGDGRSDTLVGIPDATVDVIDLRLGRPIASTKTNRDGKFNVDLTNISPESDLDFIIRKPIGGSTLTVNGIFKVGDRAAKTIDPDTTVGASVAKTQLDELVKFDPDAKAGNLSDIVIKVSKDRKFRGVPSPTLIDPDDIREHGRKWLNDRPAIGHYLGRFSGSASGNLVVFVKNGHFMMASFADDDNVFEETDFNVIALGKVQSHGVLIGRSDEVRIAGVIVDGVGTGTWQNVVSGLTGTWTVRVVATDLAGLYSGGWFSQSGDNRRGHFVAAVMENNTVWMWGRAYDRNNGQDKKDDGSKGNVMIGMAGWGRLNSDGSIPFAYGLKDRSTGTSTAHLTDGMVTGTVTNTDGKVYTFKARRDFSWDDEEKFCND
ncbi:MAG: hypothetical protein HONBIEJF_00500 [Fimbriimonadaceae bacterium]|nr:hypothetical protein [Fimbriimonadaceae bacterium]